MNVRHPCCATDFSKADVYSPQTVHRPQTKVQLEGAISFLQVFVLIWKKDYLKEHGKLKDSCIIKKSTPIWIIFKKSTTLKFSAQLAGRSIAVLTAHVTLERERLGGSAKFQELPESSAASLYY